MEHVHDCEHMPKSGTGVAVCSCGATRNVVNGNMVGEWHTCALCVSQAIDDDDDIEDCIGDAYEPDDEPHNQRMGIMPDNT